MTRILLAILVATATLLTLTGAATAAIPADSDLLDQGESYTVTFDTAGTYAYHCHPHPSMTATIHVSDTPDALEGPVNITIKNYAFTPANVTVRPGAVVTWTNEDPVAHTVTFERDDMQHGHETTPGNTTDTHDGMDMDDHAMDNGTMHNGTMDPMHNGTMDDSGSDTPDSTSDNADTQGDTSATPTEPTPQGTESDTNVPAPAIPLVLAVLALAALSRRK